MLHKHYQSDEATDAAVLYLAAKSGKRAIVTYDKRDGYYLARFLPDEEIPPIGRSGLEEELVHVMIDAQGRAATFDPTSPERIELMLEKALALQLARTPSGTAVVTIASGGMHERQLVMTPAGATTETIACDEICMKIPKGKLKTARDAFRKNGWTVEITCPIATLEDALDLAAYKVQSTTAPRGSYGT